MSIQHSDTQDYCRNGDDSTNIDLVEQLFEACSVGKVSKVQRLVEEYDVKALEPKDDKHGGTALHMAASHKHNEIVKFLIEKGNCDPIAVNKRGQNVLHRSVRVGDLKTVKYLVEERGCDPMITDNLGRNALHHACVKKDFDIMKYFMEEKKEVVNISCRERSYHLRPFDLACEGGSLELVTYLIEKHGCDNENITAGTYNTPIHQAAYGGHNDIIDHVMKKRDYTLRHLGWRNRIPLHSACIGGQVDTVRHLLGKDNTKLTCQDDAGNTPLHKAAEHNQLGVIQVLVEEFSCNITVTNKGGETPAMVAERKEHGHIKDYFERHPTGI